MPPKNHFKSRGLKYLYQERHAHQILMVELGLDNTHGMNVAHNLLGRTYNHYYSEKQRQAYGVSTVRDEWRSRDKASKPVELWKYITAGNYTQAELNMHDKLRKIIFYYAAQNNCKNYLVTGPMTPLQVTPVTGSLAETLLQTEGLASILAEAKQLLVSKSLPGAAGDGLEDDERGKSEGSASSRKTSRRATVASPIALTQGDAALAIDLIQDDVASQLEAGQDDAEVQLGFNPYDAPPLNDPQDHAQQQQANAKGWGGLYNGDEDHLNYVPSDLDEENEDGEEIEEDEEGEEDVDQDELAPPLHYGSYFFGKHDFFELRKFREQHAADFPNFAGGLADEW